MGMKPQPLKKYHSELEFDTAGKTSESDSLIVKVRALLEFTVLKVLDSTELLLLISDPGFFFLTAGWRICR